MEVINYATTKIDLTTDQRSTHIFTFSGQDGNGWYINSLNI